jgi:hypothetical protein
MAAPETPQPLFALPVHPLVIRGHATSLIVPCGRRGPCPPACCGGTLNIGDVSVHLACEHAHNLADRVQEAIDAAVLGTLPFARPGLVQ